MLLCVLAFPALADSATYATVMGGYLRLRMNPSYQARIIRSYRSGTVVTVLSRDSGWSQVITPDGRTGYMDERYLYFGGSPAPTPSTRTWTDVNSDYWVTSGNGRGVRMRSAPTTSGRNVIGLYPVGRTAFVLKKSSDGWSYIRIDGKHGYMMSQFLTPSRVEPVGPVTCPPTCPPSGNTPTPVPSSVLTSVSLSNASPAVGDTLSISVSPAEATYKVIWYRDDNQLLSTSGSYTVASGDAGHVIMVHVMGTGDSEKVIIDKVTNIVRAAPAS